MDKTDRLRDYGLAFLLYKQGLSVCGYELIRELFIFIKLILNSYLGSYYIREKVQLSTTAPNDVIIHANRAPQNDVLRAFHTLFLACRSWHKAI